jgi:hypothetical protein
LIALVHEVRGGHREVARQVDVAAVAVAGPSTDRLCSWQVKHSGHLRPEPRDALVDLAGAAPWHTHWPPSGSAGCFSMREAQLARARLTSCRVRGDR